MRQEEEKKGERPGGGRRKQTNWISENRAAVLSDTLFVATSLTCFLLSTRDYKNKGVKELDRPGDTISKLHSAWQTATWWHGMDSQQD